jgi:uncharacterized protein with PIN domain
MVHIVAVDTSALMAIALGEAEADACMRVLEVETEVVISAGTEAEALIVAAWRNVVEEVRRLIDGLGLDIVSVTPAFGTPDRRSLCAMGKRRASGGAELWRLLFLVKSPRSTPVLCFMSARIFREPICKVPIRCVRLDLPDHHARIGRSL